MLVFYNEILTLCNWSLITPFTANCRYLVLRTRTKLTSSTQLWTKTGWLAFFKHARFQNFLHKADQTLGTVKHLYYGCVVIVSFDNSAIAVSRLHDVQRTVEKTVCFTIFTPLSGGNGLFRWGSFLSPSMACTLFEAHGLTIMNKEARLVPGTHTAPGRKLSSVQKFIISGENACFQIRRPSLRWSLWFCVALFFACVFVRIIYQL